MTCVIFAASGLRRQKLAADDDVDMLVILTACYFHDIVSLAKNHPQRQRSSSWRQKRRVACSVKSSSNFRRRKSRPFVMPLPLTVSARKSRLTTEAKIVQDADRLEPWGRLAWRACLPFQGHWAWRCLMVKIRSHSIARLMINATRWIISRLSC